MNRHQEAMACFSQVIEINPRYELAWVHRGKGLSFLGRHSEAIPCFDKAIEINPKNAMPYYLKAYGLMNLKKMGEARTCFQKYLNLAPPGEAGSIEDARRMLKTLGAIGR
jgi:tetratricopeptide (TPR) repeat protein